MMLTGHVSTEAEPQPPPTLQGQIQEDFSKEPAGGATHSCPGAGGDDDECGEAPPAAPGKAGQAMPAKEEKDKPITEPTEIQRGKIHISVDPNNHTITLTGKQEYFGDGATQDYVDHATKDINDTWGGGTVEYGGDNYILHSNITGSRRDPKDAPDPDANQIHVSKDPPGHDADWHAKFDPPRQPFYGKGNGVQFSSLKDSKQHTAAHEFGHSMGLKDRYTVTVTPSGERVYSNMGKGIMARTDGKPTSQDLHELISGKGLKEVK